ncbi:hypothetical protein [Streptomyces sp. SID12488]|uniref:hypothetical protein n=1 Tax=Streptomyces sp. SID12488 TaxID=2706040 RepID=UPI0013DCA185|nr:hypothetical protein [Streptomyces sp. SID12488]NEA67522.1 hypothetical protein [Streptomyces sp. SID12488]
MTAQTTTAGPKSFTGPAEDAKAEALESCVAEFEAMREGADETLNEFIDHVVPVIRQFGDPAAFANWFLTAVEEQREKAGAS